MLSFTFLPSQAPGGNQEIDKTQIGFLQRVSGFPLQDTVSEWLRVEMLLLHIALSCLR